MPGEINKALRHQVHLMAAALNLKYSQEPFLDAAGALQLRLWKPSHAVNNVSWRLMSFELFTGLTLFLNFLRRLQSATSKQWRWRPSPRVRVPRVLGPASCRC